MSRILDRRDAGPVRVLHLDDDPDYLALVAAALERAGPFDVVSETDPEAALSWVQSGDVDCVVSAFDLPETDGLDFFAAVRTVAPGLPFVLFTGEGSEEIAARAIPEGVTDYVQKRGGREQYEALANRIGNAVERARTTAKSRERGLERYRTIVESTGDPVYTLDAEGYITYVNEALGAMTGYDTEALLGEHMGLLVPEDDVERSEALIRDLLRDEERTNDTVELDLVRADGTRVRCESHVALLPFDERFQGTAGAIRDITERKERKRELKAQNERLEESASVVSHDLRNPLQVAQGHLDLARECVDDDVESLDRVEEALDRIDAIVEDVLTLAREGGDAPDVAETAIEDVARRAWDSVDTDDARLRVETDATVRADAERVQRLFENLFRNAVEHASKRGGSRVVDGDDPDAPPGDTDPTVTVRVGHVADGSGFFVEDDGPGIDPDERDRVFESGYSTTREGTGFGLDIVEAIAASHEWDVVLTDSTLGGARFEFRSVE